MKDEFLSRRPPWSNSKKIANINTFEQIKVGQEIMSKLKHFQRDETELEKKGEKI
jgi:hypothetical protein